MNKVRFAWVLAAGVSVAGCPADDDGSDDGVAGTMGDDGMDDAVDDAMDDGDDDMADDDMADDGDSTGAADDGADDGEVPDPYAGQTNPNPPGDADAEAAGMATYTSLCATCHGDTGMGDGPSGATLVPPPTNFVDTIDGFADDYLLWTVSEGVEGTSMVGYQASLDEQQRWDVISYLRTFGG